MAYAIPKKNRNKTQKKSVWYINDDEINPSKIYKNVQPAQSIVCDTNIACAHTYVKSIIKNAGKVMQDIEGLVDKFDRVEATKESKECYIDTDHPGLIAKSQLSLLSERFGDTVACQTHTIYQLTQKMKERPNANSLEATYS